MSNLLVAGQNPQQTMPMNAPDLKPATNGQPALEPLKEEMVELFDWNIGYQRYGRGPNNFLFICGGVGKFLATLGISFEFRKS
jgi:hypothetical protein